MPSPNSCALIEIKHAEPAGMSRLGQNRTLWDVRFTPKSGHWLSVLGCPLCAKSGHSALQQGLALFDHLVGAGEKRFRNLDAERLGGCDIDDKLDFGRLL